MSAPQCPSWCADEADHDAENVAAGDDGRVHRTPDVNGQYASWDDNPTDPESAWWFEPLAVNIWAADAPNLALEMRAYAAEIMQLADQLDVIGADQ